jgi:hypothetical protein
MGPLANNIAFTASINPPGVTPVLSRAQVWAGLELKIRSAETFVPAGIQSTDVLSEDVDATSGYPVTIRDVVFVEDQRKVRETLTAHKDCKLVFVHPDGSTIQNVISDGENGELYMTYEYEWRHPGASEEEMAAFAEKEKKMSRISVNGTITAMRELAKAGKI